MSRVGSVLAWSVVALLLAGTVLLVAWRVGGGSWVRVETPSMGTTAPVGSLVWVEAVDFDDLAAGDLVTFRPAGSGTTYSHLVSAVNPDRTLSTRGRLTGPDPWRITPEQVVGRAAAVWPGIGWLLRAAPVLAGGALVVGLGVRLLRNAWLRLPLAVLGGAVVLTVAVVAYRPLLGAQQISFAPDGGTATATYVGTGLLPVRLATPEGDSVVLGPGEVGAVTITEPSSSGAGAAHFDVSLGPAVPRTWWVVLVLACFVPASFESVRVLRRRPRAPARATVHGRHLVVH